MKKAMFEELDVASMNRKQIEKIKKENKLGLSVEEIQKVQEILGRPPTRTELIIWDIQGSEHCSYRSTRAYIKQLPTEAPNIMLGVGEDAGIVEIAKTETERWGIALSHESHNHPSQVVPYEGAATGVGGNVRDIACMGAKVIGTLDSLRFGNIGKDSCRIIAREVVEGIGGYGNPLGIPNLGGSATFDTSFDDNCLVNVLCLGLVEESSIIHSYVPKEAAEENWDIIIVGKPTDNSGMGGASFASLTLSEEDKEKNKGAVQEPNPFLKRHLLHATYDLFRILKEKNALGTKNDKKHPLVSFKDMGAGGNVCSTVEQLVKNNLGAEIDLKKIHTSMENLHPSVIACSETQERFAWMCHPSLTELIVEHYNKKWDLPGIAENAGASVVGKVREGNYVLRFGNKMVCDASAEAICEGLRYNREKREKKKTSSEPELPEDHRQNVRLKNGHEVSLKELIMEVLGSENIASKEPIYERYDKTVQGITVIDRGLGDAAVIAPLIDRKNSDEKGIWKTGVAVSEAGNQRYGAISAYHQAANAVAVAMRKVAAVGAFPIALTDCLNYGNPEKPESMREIVDGIHGLKDAASGIKQHQSICEESYATPYLAGNASLYNESSRGNAITPSAIVGCLGKMDDFEKAIDMQLKQSDSFLVLIGERKDELGGSELYNLMGELGANVPLSNPTETEREIFCVSEAIQSGLALSAHVIDEGGLIVALAEMTMRGSLGMSIDMDHIASQELSILKRLFSETGGFVLEVEEGKLGDLQTLAAKNGVDLFTIGKTTNDELLTLKENHREILTLPLKEIKEAWETGLREKLYE